MTVDQLAAKLAEFQKAGHGNTDIYYRHSASGDSGVIWSARITDIVSDETGPFDLDGAEFVELSIGGN